MNKCFLCSTFIVKTVKITLQNCFLDTTCTVIYITFFNIRYNIGIRIFTQNPKLHSSLCIHTDLCEHIEKELSWRIMSVTSLTGNCKFCRSKTILKNSGSTTETGNWTNERSTHHCIIALHQKWTIIRIKMDTLYRVKKKTPQYTMEH